jgi:exosome complex RNA-binding protein Rrp4
MVIGLNGYIWLSDHVPDEEDREREAQEEQQVTRVIEVSDAFDTRALY